LRGGGLPGAGTYVAPSLNHAGCVITTSRVLSFHYFEQDSWWSAGSASQPPDPHPLEGAEHKDGVYTCFSNPLERMPIEFTLSAFRLFT